MRTQELCRRDALARAGLLAGVAMFGKTGASAEAAGNPAVKKTERPFLFCLNMATIRGQKLGIVKEIEGAAEAGYDAIEPWGGLVQNYCKEGGALGGLK